MVARAIRHIHHHISSHTLTRNLQKTGYLRDLEQLVRFAALRTSLPTVARIGMMLRIPELTHAHEAAPRIRAHAIRSLALYDRLRQEDPIKLRQTLFTKVFDAGEDGTLSFEEIVTNAQGYVVAGSDTTAITLTYLVWALGSRPDLKQALVEELKTLPPDFQDTDLKALLHLNNIINETLRVYSSVPSALPRQVPSGGANLAGYWIPEGTTVCCQAYSMHRNPEIWPEPDEFKPSRWVNPTKAMTDAFMPFGAGSRSKCINITFLVHQVI